MSRLLLSGRHLLYSTELAAVIGRNEAICLQQIHYWMGVQGGKVVDGVKWFWKTYPEWSIELNLSVSTVRRVIANLKKFDLIRVDRLSAKTYYQASWYTLNHEALEALIQNEQIEAPTVNTSKCSKKATHNKESSSRKVTPQELSAAELQKVEVEETNNQELKQSQDSCKVTELTPDATNKQNPHEGYNPGAREHDKTTDNTEKMTSEELRNVTIELREIPCTPAFKINPQVLATIKKHPHNVKSAIAYLKEALRTWDKVNSPEAVFSKACKEGLKPANWGKTAVTYPQPNDEQLAELKYSLSKREIRDFSKAPSGLWFVDTGASILPWWEYLQVQI